VPVAPTKMSLFKPVYLDKRVTLSPTEYKDISGSIDDFLTEKLRKELESQCCTHGYVRPGSTQILSRSMGTAEHGRFTGDFIFHCKVRVACLLPHEGQVLECRVLMVNKLGAYALIVDEGRVREAMRILIPRDLHLGNAEFDALQPDQGIRVRVLKAKFAAGDTFIQAVGMYEGAAAAAAAPPPESKKAAAAAAAGAAETDA
jgi:hypothetical protein